MKQKKNNVRWLVAVRHPRPPRGFRKNEIFGFPTKRAAFSFMKEISGLGAECAFAYARKEIK